MPSATFYPSVSSDDGFLSSTGSEFYNSTSYLAAGGYGGTYYHLFVRFPDITIPTGSTISSAYVKFKAYDNQSNAPCNINIYTNDVDDSTAPTNAGQFDALVLTSAVAWNGLPSWVNGTTYDTPDIKTIIQAVVTRLGWSSGNAMTLVLKDNGSTNVAHRKSSSIDYLSGTEKAELYIEWELPAAYEFEGYVYALGVPVSRQLYLYNREDGTLITSTTSSGNGYYYMTTTASGEYFVVCLDDPAAPDYNDLITGPIYGDEIL